MTRNTKDTRPQSRPRRFSAACALALAGATLHAQAANAAMRDPGCDLAREQVMSGPATPWSATLSGRDGLAAAIAAIDSASAHGLQPERYDPAGKLRERARMLLAQAPADVPDAWHNHDFNAPTHELRMFDRELSVALSCLAQDMHLGLLAAAEVHRGVHVAERRFESASALHEARSLGRVDDFFARAAPDLRIYTRLRQALAEHRQLALQPFEKVTEIETGAGPEADMKALKRLKLRLEQLGDLAPDTADADMASARFDASAKYARNDSGTLTDVGRDPPVDHDSALDRYAPTATGATHSMAPTAPLRLEGALLQALNAFKTRHGLPADGTLDEDTLAQLNVTPAERARQIEISMERLRWLPRLENEDTLIAVNIPSFRLWAMRRADDQLRPVLEMPVVVGKAKATQTPMFVGEMKWIEFSPTWTVPYSIAARSVVPKLRRNPGLMDTYGYQIRMRDGTVTNVATAAALDQAARARARIVQRPGPKNALGRMKFMMPNDMDIYLHDTSARELFNKDRRDYSSGCVRVGKPKELAQFLLADQPRWTPARIDEASSRDRPVKAPLKRSVNVAIMYLTAMVDENESVSFVNDIYGYDKPLRAALDRAEAASLADSGE